MKKLLLPLTVVSGVLLAAFLYERLFIEHTFGVSAILGVAILGGFFLFLLLHYIWRNTPRNETFVRIWLVGTSTLVSYFVLDLAAGLILIQPLSPVLVPDQFRHHKLVPNSFSKLQQQDFSYVQYVNNLGLRGADTDPKKAPGSYRILTLGDSFTMGKGVEDDKAWSVLLEKLLNEARPAGCGIGKFQVLNGGVDSYAPILSYLQLSRDLAPLQPDMIVLNLDVSDLIQESVYRQQAVVDANGQIVAVPLGERQQSLTDRMRDWIDQHLFFSRALLYYINGLFGFADISVRDVVTQANFEIVAHTLEADQEDRTEQWRRIFESITRIERYAAEHGIEFVLSVYPWAHQVSDKEWQPGREIFMPPDAAPSDRNRTIVAAFAAKHGIALADLFPAFRAYDGERPLYFAHDPHWTETGNEVMAAGLAAELRSRFEPAWCASTATEHTAAGNTGAGNTGPASPQAPSRS